MTVKTLNAVAAAIILGGGLTAGAKPLEEETPILAESLAKQLVEKKRPKVAVLDFNNIQGEPNELGRFLSEQLAVDMVPQKGITLLDRANISAVMAEHRLTSEGLVKPENAKKLGQFAGVDALLIGSLASMGESFVLTVKAISTETAEIVAAGRCKFDVNEELMQQFNSSLSGGSSGRTSAQSGAVAGKRTKAIASKRIGNLEIELVSVIPAVKRVQPSYTSPIDLNVINCSFMLSNRDLKKSVAVAANGVLDPDNRG